VPEGRDAGPRDGDSSGFDVAKVGRGSFLLVASRAASAGVFLLLTPFVIARLGPDQYGIWVLVATATGIFGLFDVGAASALGRLVAHATARGDREAITSTVTTGVVFRGAQSIAVATAGWFVVPLVAGHLSLPADLHADAIEALRAGIAMGVVVNVASAFNGVLIGFARMAPVAGINLGSPIVFALVALVVLVSGGNVVGLAIGQLVVQTLRLAALAAAARHAHGGRLVVAAAFRLASVRDLLKFGLPRQLSSISFNLAIQYERLLIGIFVGAAAAGRYGPAGFIVGGLAGLLLQAAMPLMPALTEIAVKRGAEGLATAYAKAIRYFSILSAAALGVLAATATPLVAAWLGPGFGATPRYIQLLAAGFLLRSIAEVGFSAVQAARRPGLESTAAAVAISVNVVVSLVLVAALGAGGGAVGTAAALAVGALAFFGVLVRRDADGLGRAVREAIFPCASAAALVAPFAVINAMALRHSNLGRPQLGLIAASEAAIFLALYLLALRARGYRLVLPGRNALFGTTLRASAGRARSAGV
jgi:O-antigen/teichoic acid export membrane protein